MIRLTFILAAITSFGLGFSPGSQALAGDASESGFSQFLGVWILKDDRFQQVWDGKTVETLSIPNHMTQCTTANTFSSVSCAVDAGGFKGQIFWVADPAHKTLHHLSHFGESRTGVGTGQIDTEGNLINRIAFTDEPDGTYRIYEYDWVSDDEYTMMSRQFNADDEPTGNWYGGTFVRVTMETD